MWAGDDLEIWTKEARLTRGPMARTTRDPLPPTAVLTAPARGRQQANLTNRKIKKGWPHERTKEGVRAGRPLENPSDLREPRRPQKIPKIYMIGRDP